LRNIQVIDRADNSTYGIFAATEEEFEAIFSAEADIEFAGDFFERVMMRSVYPLFRYFTGA
jgi:hypothetical protein